VLYAPSYARTNYIAMTANAVMKWDVIRLGRRRRHVDGKVTPAMICVDQTCAYRAYLHGETSTWEVILTGLKDASRILHFVS
jgi:hypothetical protein